MGPFSGAMEKTSADDDTVIITAFNIVACAAKRLDADLKSLSLLQGDFY